MIIKYVMRTVLIAIMIWGVSLTSVMAADINIRATANSNENDVVNSMVR